MVIQPSFGELNDPIITIIKLAKQNGALRPVNTAVGTIGNIRGALGSIVMVNIITCLPHLRPFMQAHFDFPQIGTSYVSDRDFAALDYLDETLLGDARPHRPFEHTIDYGLEKLVSP